MKMKEENYNLTKLRIGVIGVGHMGKNHVRILATENRFELVGIYDKDPEQLEEVAEEYHVKPYKDIKPLLNDVDAVVIAVPSSLHKDVALEAAKCGVHALVEKPLALNSRDAGIISEAFADHNLKLAVGHIERFNPVFRELKKLVKPEEIYYIEAVRYSPYSSSGRITDTSVVEDLMIHDIDLVCNLMEGCDVSSLHGRGEVVKSKQIDFATCLLDFGGRAHAVVNASRTSQNKERMMMVHTKEGCIHADLLNRTMSIYKSTNLTVDLENNNSYVQEGVVSKVYVPIEEPLRAELISFHNAIAENKDVMVGGGAATAAIKICEEISNRANINS